MFGRLLRQIFRHGPDAARVNELGISLWQQGDLAGAEARFREVLARHPLHAAACSNLGMVLVEQRRFGDGMELLARAIELDPGHAGARINLANTVYVDGRVDEALPHYREALRLDPRALETRVNVLKPFMDICDWDGVARIVDELIERRRRGDESWSNFISPFVALLLPLPQEMQKAVALRHGRELAAAWSPRRSRIAALRPGRGGDRIRIGYVSGDLRNHATGHLTAGMFERHDRSRFEVLAYSWNPDDGSSYRRRIAAGCDRFIDLAGESYEQSAARMASDGVDVLVDLCGYIGGSRAEIFALRPAPLQVQWLGYPGTMGADFIDYVVADELIVPKELAVQFTESIAWLPRCYQVNDGAQPVAHAHGSREQAGLPPAGFVFCCFNQSYKIDSQVFGCWMRLLAAVPGSVLWLLVGSDLARQNLRRHAAQCGIAPDRLIFTAGLPKPEHLARHGLADLFLDTWVVNAHTTASDALWAGLPVLTCAGNTFASRVAGSLVRAVGLPELVAGDRVQYEELAITLARDPARLAALRRRLAEARSKSPLFDTAGFVRDLERAFEIMWQRREAGENPNSFEVV